MAWIRIPIGAWIRIQIQCIWLPNTATIELISNLGKAALSDHVPHSEGLVPNPERHAGLDEGQRAGQVQVAGVLARMLRQLVQQAKVGSGFVRFLHNEGKLSDIDP